MDEDDVEARVRRAVVEAQAKDSASFESYRLRRENHRLRAALRLACQELRGPGVPVDDLLADFLRAGADPPRD